MTTDQWWFCGLGAVVIVVNIATTRRVWASPFYERSQQIAQTVLLWLIPGSFLVIRNMLREMEPGSSGRADRTSDVDSDLRGYIGSLPERHDGWDDGGHHGGGHDGGGGHHGGGDFGGY